MLGGELDLRLFSYRDTTPLGSRPGRRRAVRRRRRDGAARRRRRRGARRRLRRHARGHRVVALTPQGRQLTQEVVEELAKEEHLTLLSARFEGFDERIVEHLCTDSISIGPYVLSNGDLPAMVLVDAIARRLPGALARGLGRARVLLRGARRRARAPALHAPGRVPRLARSRRAAVGRPRPRSSAGGRSMCVEEPHRPPDRGAAEEPGASRSTGSSRSSGAILIVLAIKQWVINPYRIPSSSMEPTLHCALPGRRVPARAVCFSGSDRVLACRFCYDLWSPKRGDIIVFNTPPQARWSRAATGRRLRQAADRPARRHLGGERTATSTSTASGSTSRTSSRTSATTTATGRRRSRRATTS